MSLWEKVSYRRQGKEDNVPTHPLRVGYWTVETIHPVVISVIPMTTHVQFAKFGGYLGVGTSVDVSTSVDEDACVLGRVGDVGVTPPVEYRCPS